MDPVEVLYDDALDVWRATLDGVTYEEPLIALLVTRLRDAGFVGLVEVDEKAQRACTEARKPTSPKRTRKKEV